MAWRGAAAAASACVTRGRWAMRQTCGAAKRPLGISRGLDVLGGVKEGTMKITVDGFHEDGFLIGSMDIKSSIFLLPNSFFLWKPRSMDEVTLESLLLPTLVTPRIEMLIIGKGARNSAPLPPVIVAYFKKQGIALEHMSTSHALATYNVLTSEDRNVAAALLTVEPTDPENGAIAASMEEYVPTENEDPFRASMPEIVDGTARHTGPGAALSDPRDPRNS